MSKSERCAIEQLDQLDQEFRQLLLSCLQECARGRWGLFQQNAHPEALRYLAWPEADQLRNLALRILKILQRTGEQNQLVEMFLNTCSISGGNTPGEPQIARALLERINAN